MYIAHLAQIAAAIYGMAVADIEPLDVQQLPAFTEKDNSKFSETMIVAIIYNLKYLPLVDLMNILTCTDIVKYALQFSKYDFLGYQHKSHAM